MGATRGGTSGLGSRAARRDPREDVLMDPVYGHEQDLRGRAALRDKAARVANSGTLPEERFDKDTLYWAFEGCQEELETLREIAREVHGEKCALEQSRAEKRQLVSMTERVLREWDAQ